MLAPQEVKACCAGVYSSAVARFLLGDSFHPGGAVLTSRLIQALRVGLGDSVVDVACGPGTSALQLVEETGCEAIGVDLIVPDASPHPRLRFVQGDAEALPLEDASADGVLCECALCTFPDKPTAVRELARVLRPGARVAIADVTATPDELPPELRSLEAWIACVADARPIAELVALLESAGLEPEVVERHDQALAELLDRVEARLRLARLAGFDAAPLEPFVALVRDALSRGALGYAVLVARRP